MGNRTSVAESLLPIERAEYLTNRMMRIYEKELDICIPSGIKCICLQFVGKILIERAAVSSPAKFSHAELLKEQVIIDVDQEPLRYTKANVNNLVYYFTQISGNKYEMEIKYKVGFGAKISPFPEPFMMDLHDLDKSRKTGVKMYEAELIKMSVQKLLSWLPSLKCNLKPLKY